MDIFRTIKDTQNCLLELKKKGRKVGFVPTMGALHQGHLALLQRAKKENEIAVASIFVNPLQFNDKKDLEKYPRTLEKDAEMLISVNCDVLFAPSAEEMYPDSPVRPLSVSLESQPQVATAGQRGMGESGSPYLDLGNLDKVMEGLHRPGHFNGVCVVVKKLFDIVQPDKAYFGEKDFQQLAVIKHMVRTLKMPVEIVPCPTVREADGLAMSSRNALLGADERKNAPLIYKTLEGTRDASRDLSTGKGQGTIKATREYVEKMINENPFLKLEYFEIVNSETLQPVSTWNETKNMRACIAVKAGSVRLIDNIAL